MRRLHRILATTEGFTMVEVLITIAVISILVAFALTSFDAVKAKARYGQVRADMDAIAQAAYNDYTTNMVWAPLSMGSLPPYYFVTTNELRKWPTPPCPGWYYSWEDWSVFGSSVTQVTLRRSNNTLLWGYCVDTSAGGSANCQISDPIFGGSSATDLSQVTARSIYCNE